MVRIEKPNPLFPRTAFGKRFGVIKGKASDINP
jgi:hypothetical protein